MEPQIIQTKIFNIRGQMVMLDFDLAEFYEVETKRMKEPSGEIWSVSQVTSCLNLP